MDDRPFEDLFDSFQGIFGDLFAGAPRRELRMELVLELREAVEGVRRELTLAKTVCCEACRGGGGAPGATFSPCASCRGTGGERQTQGFFALSTSCPGCHGKRGVWSEACAACHGSARRTRPERVIVTVPGGVTDGHVLRLAGKGNDLGDGQGPGDALLTIAVRSDPHLTRQGDDLHLRAGVPEPIAERGGEIELALPSGAHRLRVKGGVKSGDELTLRGWGAVKLGSPATPITPFDEPYRSVDTRDHRGDLVVTFEVEGQPLPDEKLTPDEHAARENATSDARFAWGVVAGGVVLALALAYAALT